MLINKDGGDKENINIVYTREEKKWNILYVFIYTQLPSPNNKENNLSLKLQWSEWMN